MSEIEELKEMIRDGLVQNPKKPRHSIYDFINKSHHQLTGLMNFLKNEAFFNKNDIVLEIGMGTGTFTSLIAPFVKWIISCEIDEEHVMESVQTIDYFQMNNVSLFWGTVDEYNHNGFKVHFPNEKFDKVIAQGSFRKPEDIEKFILMAKRVRKKDGKILISYNPYYFITNEAKLIEHEKLSRNIYLRRKDKPKYNFDDLLGGLKIQAEYIMYKKFPMPDEAYVELSKYYKSNEIDLIKEKGHIYPMRTVILT
ncbi:MAG: tRNA (guanine-N(7)-)-methyltransferase [Candidatus Heimdallarchaeota archaeon LC_3]|nr:MAG: tRNA (guanine-N(7)-)-methyltransferase [Candidatus Heimdallarchaeota archaeon LC_3]